MSYLKNNNNKVVVDAILTSYGKTKLASKGTLDITKFAVADDEIDYGLYNHDHPDGTDYYNSAIVNLPILQALPENYLSMKYPLFSSTTKQIDAIAKMRLNFSSEMTSSGISNFSIYPIAPSFVPEPGDITIIYYVARISIPQPIIGGGGGGGGEPILYDSTSGGGGGGGSEGATGNGMKFLLNATINENIGMTNAIIAARGFYRDTAKYKYAVGHGFTFQVTRFGRQSVYLPTTISAFGINARPVGITIKVNGRVISDIYPKIEIQ